MKVRILLFVVEVGVEKTILTSCFAELGSTSTVIGSSPSRIDKYIVLVQKPDSFPK